MRKYDYLIVGAGLFGATFAHEMTKAGRTCIAVEKKHHVGGLCASARVEGIDVHLYGAHIFKTDDKETWEFINQFGEFNNFVNTPIAICDGEAYNLPFNMNTFAKVFGVVTPEEARKALSIPNIEAPSNLEDYAISKVGKKIYDMFIKGYTEKQWGKPCSQLPMTILSDIPIRYTYNNNYYNKRFQGVPMCGYDELIRKMFRGISVITGISYKGLKRSCDINAKKIIYTGPIDEFFDYKFGVLKYRSLKFEHKVFDCPNKNGVAVTNYVDKNIPYTRVIEHKHFCNHNSDSTVLTYEFPQNYEIGGEAYYPLNDEESDEMYAKYVEYAKRECPDIIFCGRLGSYRYDDMAECIERARKLAREELSK
ncbi:MAG: UDP-galactopyranose mutase [Ruminococcus sp.]|nr:UDP-galactopyranose mutase [Ruminococcus sp.]